MREASDSPRCPACDAQSVRRLRDIRARSAVFSGRGIWRCDECGMHFVAPMPSDRELADYNASYFENAHAGAADSAAAQAFRSGVNLVRAEHVERIRREAGIDVRRVLEVGPGRGEFAAHWLKLHPGTDYHVIESDDSCREALSGRSLQIHRSAIEPELGAGKFDLLVMSHVLEHTSEPAPFLESLLRHLSERALIFIEVPCRDDEHKAEDEPHLLFFDRKPMERLFHWCGIEPLRISYHGVEIARLRAGWATSPSFAQRIADRLRPIAERLHLLARPGDLALIEDPVVRAAVRRLEAHLEKEVPAWWLRAVGRVQGARTAS